MVQDWLRLVPDWFRLVPDTDILRPCMVSLVVRYTDSAIQADKSCCLCRDVSHFYYSNIQCEPWPGGLTSTTAKTAKTAKTANDCHNG